MALRWRTMTLWNCQKPWSQAGVGWRLPEHSPRVSGHPLPAGEMAQQAPPEVLPHSVPSDQHQLLLT